MSIRSVSSRRRTLAACVSLLGCSLASTVHGQAMNYTSIVSGSGSLSIGSLAGSFSVTGPTNLVYEQKPYLGGNAYLAVIAANLGGLLPFDFIYAEIGYLNGTTAPAGSASGSFTLTFSTRVTFADFGPVSGGEAATWTVNSAVVADGDVFEIGTYTFNFSNSGPFAFNKSSLKVGAYFAQAPASAVPLPGAAGLAACGLIGLSRRRR